MTNEEIKNEEKKLKTTCRATLFSSYNKTKHLCYSLMPFGLFTYCILCYAGWKSDLSQCLTIMMSVIGCKCHINPCTLTDHKSRVWTWCFDLHPRTKTKRQKGLSVATAGKGIFNSNRKITIVFIQKTNSRLTLPGLSLFQVVCNTKWRHQTSWMILIYIENSALAQRGAQPGHSCKKYDFLPLGAFLFMSECRSG